MKPWLCDSNWPSPCLFHGCHLLHSLYISNVFWKHTERVVGCLPCGRGHVLGWEGGCVCAGGGDICFPWLQKWILDLAWALAQSAAAILGPFLRIQDPSLVMMGSLLVGRRALRDRQREGQQLSGRERPPQTDT